MNTKKIIATEIWLNYFNQYLFEKNIITEAERNKMKNIILLKYCADKNVSSTNGKMSKK